MNRDLIQYPQKGFKHRHNCVCLLNSVPKAESFMKDGKVWNSSVSGDLVLKVLVLNTCNIYGKLF